MKLLLTLQIVKKYLMLKKIAFYILTVILASNFVACNKDSNDEGVSSSNVAVTAFVINKNDSVLKNIDSVFFSIDLVNARIFNADSLPYGTDVSELQVHIETLGSSVADLTFSRSGKKDTTINYLKSPNDKIDFSNGPVKLHLVALDGVAQRDYSISVNVHKIKPDSLFWNKLSKNRLPSNFNNPNVQKTIKYKGNAVCISGIHPQYTLATIENPGNFYWDIQDITFPFTPDINSLNATDEALFILDNEGNLHSSIDGITWSSCNTKWHHIYGGYDNKLIGVTEIDGKYYHTTYPESTLTPVNEDCPISGTSPFVSFDSEWSSTPQVFVMGGRRSDGKVIGDMWGYDGSTWAKISTKGAYPREDMTFFAYYTFDTNTSNWNVTKYPTLIAFGGFDQEGHPGKKVYISIDMGINWKLADDLLQLPEYIPEMGSAQALVFDRTITARGTSEWVDYPSKQLPSWCEIYAPTYSRVSQYPSQWECPYIYLFGGYDYNGNLYNSIWRGVLNRLSFKPIV